MNGDEPVQTTKDENGVETEVPPKTAQALLQRQKERKAKIILLLSIPDEYQLRFHTIKDAKSLWAAIKSRFGGNVHQRRLGRRVFEADIKGSSGSSSNTHEEDRFFVGIRHNSNNESSGPQLDDEYLKQLDHDNLSRDNTRRTVPVETSDALVV
ncbi:hypothetical protein Tco_1103524 [Tanacetum coccineum]